MKVWCILFCLLVVVRTVKVDYHKKIGIPLAARIKEYEDKLFAGEPEMEPRIIGGDIAPVFAHPYLAGLLIRLHDHSASVCCSSLVTLDRLVTTAHCLVFVNTIKVVLGTPFLYHGGIRIITKKFTMHPEYNPFNNENYDIGVVQLPKPVESTGTIHPIRLPLDENDAEKYGEWATAAGWGLISDDLRGKEKSLGLIVNEVKLRIVHEVRCWIDYELSVTLVRSTVCTDGIGKQQQPVGACDGDSGGPLVVDRDQKVLVGVVSHGYSQCNGTLPTVFTRTMFYKNFILNASLFS